MADLFMCGHKDIMKNTHEFLPIIRADYFSCMDLIGNSHKLHVLIPMKFIKIFTRTVM